MLATPGLPTYRPRRVLYYYRLDPQFGLMYLRLQTWFPDTMQVDVNGHDWLAWQLTWRKLGFTQCDNAFTQLDSPQPAQQISRCNAWPAPASPISYRKTCWHRPSVPDTFKAPPKLDPHHDTRRPLRIPAI
jgi:hypothetical protein